jgi:hypothetical protein
MVRPQAHCLPRGLCISVQTSWKKHLRCTNTLLHHHHNHHCPRVLIMRIYCQQMLNQLTFLVRSHQSHHYLYFHHQRRVRRYNLGTGRTHIISHQALHPLLSQASHMRTLSILNYPRLSQHLHHFSLLHFNRHQYQHHLLLTISQYLHLYLNLPCLLACRLLSSKKMKTN